MAHQVADQAGIILHSLGPPTVGDAGRLHDRVVVTHIVDDAHESVVQNLMRIVEVRLHARNRGAARRALFAAGRFDFSLLIGGEGHREIGRASCRERV